MRCDACGLRASSRWRSCCRCSSWPVPASCSSRSWMHAEGIVTAAVQDGARIASSEAGTLEQGAAAARSLLRDGLGPNAALVQLLTREDASTVRFEASGTLPAIFPWGPVTTIPLHASASMARDHFVP